MKHLYVIAASLLLMLGAGKAFAQSVKDESTAQKIYVCEGFDDEDYSLEKYSDLNFSDDGTQFTIGDDIYDIADVDSITFTKPVFPCVNIVWNGNSATVTVDPSITGVTYTTNGGHVSITSKNVTNEILYVLSGSSSDGSLTLTGEYKLRLNLNGVSLVSSKGAAIDIQCGKRVEVKLMKNTVNTFVDCTGGEQKAAFYCKGHMEIKGKGTLNVTGRTKHALMAKEYLQFKQSTGTVNILSAVNDGIHCGRGEQGTEHNLFIMNGGNVTISNCQSDCVDSDDYGSMQINGGTLTLNVSQTDGNGLACDSILYMTGGEVIVNVTGIISNGVRFNYDSQLSGGKIQCTVSGNGSKGIKAKRSTKTTDTVQKGGFAHFAGTDVTMTVSGGTYATDGSECVGIRVDRDLYQTAGSITIHVTNSAATGLSARSDKWDGVSGTRNIYH